MLIPCKDIAQSLQDELKKEVDAMRAQNIKPKLVTVLVGDASEQRSFVRIKRKVAEKIGVEFELIHLAIAPPFDEFLQLIQKKINESGTTGIIIQHPLPKGYNATELYQIIPYEKEIEGHKPESTFVFPLSLSVLTGLKYIFLKEDGNESPLKSSIVDFQQDQSFFKTHLQNKHIIIAGRGTTGGAPIAKALKEIGVSFEVVHSMTKNADSYFSKADIIITATGKPIITKNMIKKDVILLNVGLRKNKDGKLKGDYDEEDIQEKASYYTETPGGLGPLDVLYLYKNLLTSVHQ